METVLIRLHFNLRPRNIIMVERWHTCSLCSKKWRRNVARYDSDSFIPVASVKMAAMADGSTYPAIRAAASPGRARASTGQNIQIGVFIFIMDQLHGANCWLETWRVLASDLEKHFKTFVYKNRFCSLKWDHHNHKQTPTIAGYKLCGPAVSLHLHVTSAPSPPRWTRTRSPEELSTGLRGTFAMPRAVSLLKELSQQTIYAKQEFKQALQAFVFDFCS